MPQDWFDQGTTASPAPQRRTYGTPDPSFQYKAPKAAADVTNTQTSTAKTAAEIPYVAPKAQADIRNTELQNQKLAQTLAKGADIDSVKAAAIAQYGSAQQLDGIIAELKSSYAKGPGSTKGIRGLEDYLPTPSNSDFNSIANRTRGIVRNALGLTGGENNTAQESKMNIGAYIPQAADYDNVIESKIKSLEELRDNAYKQSIQKLGGVPDANGNVTPVKLGQNGLPVPGQIPTGAVGGGSPPSAPSSIGPNAGTPPPSGGGPQGPDTPQSQTIATQSYAAQPDPNLKGVAGQYRQMLANGSGLQDILGFLQSKGISDPSRLQTAVQQYQFHQNNPGVPVNPHTYDARDLENKVVPVSGLQQLQGNFAMSPVGAWSLNTMDGVTGGWADEAAGLLGFDADKMRMAQAVTSAVNPGSAFIGQLGGGAAAAAGLEGAGGALGAGARWAPRLGDLGYGAISGAGNADEGNRSLGAVEGALLGLGGGMAARGATSAIGNAARGVTDPVVRYLADAGVPLTAGQVLGGSARTLENKATSLPIVGDAIKDRYGEGFLGFNRAAMDEALAGIGAQAPADVGNAGIDAAQNAVSQAYRNALDGVTVTADQPFVGDMNAAILSGNALPEPMRGNIQYTLPTRVGEAFDPNGNLTGNNFQQAVRGLRSDASSVGSQPFGNDFGNVTRQAEGALEGLLNRQAPGVVDDYRAANQAFRRVGILQDAVDKARGGSASGETEVFTPAQLLASASKNAKRFDNTQGTTRLPFYDLASAGQQALPSAIPNSGTVDRAILASLAGTGSALAGGGTGYAAGGDAQSAGIGAAAAPVAIAALLLAGSRRGTQDAVVRALMDRPDWLRDAGNTLTDRVVRPAGWLGASGGALALSDQ